MKVLIIGGTGFIGRNLLEALGPGHTVKAPARAELDICDGGAVESYLRSGRFDVLINAADYRPPDGEAFDAKRMAASRLRAFFNLARCGGLYGKMIFFGSGAEYGRELPVESISEESFDRAVPSDEYGFCLGAMTRHASMTDNIINLRLFGIFGKYELWKTRFISNAVCKALCGYPITLRQDAFFDYLYMDDLVRIVRWAMSAKTAHSHYNAVSGRRLSLLELAGTVREVTGADVPIFTARDGLGREYTASNQRLRLEMGGFSAMPVRESIKDLCRYYKDNMDIIDRYYLLYQ